MDQLTEEKAKGIVKNNLQDFMHSEMGADFNRAGFTNCINPEHPDHNPSMNIYTDKEGHHRAKCHSCGANYDIFDAVAIQYGLSTGEAFRKTYEIYGLNVKNAQEYQNHTKTEQNTDTSIHTTAYTQEESQKVQEYIELCHSRIQEIDYPQQRGLSDDIIKRARLGYDPQFSTGTNGDTWEALIIPTKDNSYVARNINPDASLKNRYRKIGGIGFFGLLSIQYTNTPLYVVEGELDVLSIMEAGGFAIGLGSIANANSFIKTMKDFKPDNSFIIALDNDDRGISTAKTIEKGLREANIPAYTINPYGEYKDANDMLMNDRDALESFISKSHEAKNLEELVKELKRKEYEKNNTASYLQDFINGIAESASTEAISTGFNSLDKRLDGGLYESLYTVGAVSSLGKTTFITQITDQIAEAGGDVLIFSLEMARNELMAKTISRHTLRETLMSGGDTRNAKTARGITTGSRWEKYSPAEVQLINKSIEEYGKYANNIYVKEGLGDITAKDIRQQVEEHVSLTGKRPVVVVDYLQILSPHDPRMPEKWNTDKAVMELKRISRDYKIPVIAISSFNRENYENAVTMKAFKESGGIEYSADVVIGLQFKGAGGTNFHTQNARKKTPREIQLVILKNRHGEIGDPIDYEYYPMFNYFKEA